MHHERVPQGTEATIYRMVTDEHICPFGIKSVDLLRRKGFEVKDKWLTSRAEVDAFKAKHDVKTTPQIFLVKRVMVDMKNYVNF